MFKYIITTFIALVFSFSSFANTSWDDILNAKKAPQNWLTHHGSLDGHRFSGLKRQEYYLTRCYQFDHLLRSKGRSHPRR